MSHEQGPGRVRFMDAQRVNLDGFAEPNAALGLVAMASPSDPRPSLVITDGRVSELVGVLARFLPDTVTVGRGKAGATLSDTPLGHRYAVALGLALFTGAG